MAIPAAVAEFTASFSVVNALVTIFISGLTLFLARRDVSIQIAKAKNENILTIMNSICDEVRMFVTEYANSDDEYMVIMQREFIVGSLDSFESLIENYDNKKLSRKADKFKSHASDCLYVKDSEQIQRHIVAIMKKKMDIESILMD